MKPKSLEHLNLLINLSCHSGSLKPMDVAFKKKGEFRKERSQINTFIHAPFGEFKSTIFKFIEKYYPAITLTDITFPKLVGSYDVESRAIVPSSCWEYRNKTIILDEFHFREGIINALLQMIEGGEYIRAVARNMIKNTNKRDGDLYFRCSKTGTIKVKSRFNCIIGTMHNVFRIPHITYDALISRCIPIYYSLFPDDFKAILDGDYKLFNHLKFFNPLMKIEYKDVEFIWNVVNNSSLVKAEYKYNLIARTIGDCLRCFNILKEHNIELYKFIISMKGHLPDVRFQSKLIHGKRKRRINAIPEVVKIA